MRHSPLCFTGISALGIRSFTSSLSLGERHRRAGELHLQGWFPGRSSRLRQRMPWANPILACSVFPLFPHSAGARLFRMTRARKGSGCCHRAVIRHIQEFGIVSECMPADSGAQASRFCSGFDVLLLDFFLPVRLLRGGIWEHPILIPLEAALLFPVEQHFCQICRRKIKVQSERTIAQKQGCRRSRYGSSDKSKPSLSSVESREWKYCI